jgi:thioredoxin 2
MIRCAACSALNRVPLEKFHRGIDGVCGRCKEPLHLFEPVTITDANFADEVEQSALPVLIDLWAPWCGPCRMVTPIVEQLAREWASRMRVGKLNIDDNPATAARFNVRSIPTLLILKGGRELDRIVGAAPKPEIVRRLEQIIAPS